MILRHLRLLLIVIFLFSDILFSSSLPAFAITSSSSGQQTTSKLTSTAHLTRTNYSSTEQYSQNPATDFLPVPSWWNGLCDTKNYFNAKGIQAFPLGTSYRGVLACGPRPQGNKSLDYTVQFFPGAFGEYEWECVELSMRYMYLAYGINPYDSPSGANVVDNYTKHNTNPILIPIQNTNPPSIQAAPQPGDIVSYYSNHTAVVIASNVNNQGDGTLTVMEQNASSNGHATINVGSNAGLPPWVLDLKVKNWLQHTVDLVPQSGPPTMSVNISGMGFAPNEQVTIYFDATTLGTTNANSMGIVAATITIPQTATPGRHYIQLVGNSSKFSPATIFYVHTDWPRFGYDLQNSRYNPYENELSKSNVSQLIPGWTFPNTYGFATEPMVVNNVAYVGSSNNQFYALDASQGTILWTASTGAGIYAEPAVANGIVYVGSDDDKLYAFDAITGATLWSATTGSVIEAAPTVANGIVYVNSFDSNLYAFDALTGAQKWLTYTGAVDSSPAVVNGVVYVGSNDNDGKLYAIDALHGNVLWTGATGNSIDSSPAVVNGIVYIGSKDDKLYAFNALGCKGNPSCSPIWAATTGGWVNYSSPAVVNGVVYIGCVDGKLYAFNAKTGKLLWTGATIGKPYIPIYGSPSIANGVVYIGSTDYRIYAFNAAGCGKKSCLSLWNYATTYWVMSAPAIVNGTVYISSYDGGLYSFHLPGMNSR